MPIGKNAIKRVENNGYSKVESSAPDMENSSVIANIDQQVVEKIIAPVEKKTAAKKAPAKKAEPVVEAPVEVKTEEIAKTKRKYVRKAKVEEVSAKPKRKYVRKAKVEEVPAKPKRKYVRKNVVKKEEDKFARVEVGTNMPYFLL